MQALATHRGPNPFPPGIGRTGVSATLCVALLLAGCATRESDFAPTLTAAPAATAWPSPPEVARYALAGVLIGAQDFIEPDERKSSGVQSAFEWIVGLVVGPRRYKELRRPVAGLVREDGSVLVVDAGHKGVAVFDMVAKRFEIWDEASPGAGFVSPVAIAEDGSGGYLVTDSELKRVVRLDAQGKPAGDFGGGVLSRPTGIARDPLIGTIYVADTSAHDVKVFDQAGFLIDTIGGPGREVGRLNTPTHMVFHDDRLYVVDTLNFRVQAFNRDGTPVFDFGELGLFVGNMSRPKGVAIGGEGRIYVVESLYDHLLIFDSAGQLLLPIGGSGREIGQFYLPAGVWTDDQRRVYVADMFNGRVIVLAELTGMEGKQ